MKETTEPFEGLTMFSLEKKRHLNYIQKRVTNPLPELKIFRQPQPFPLSQGHSY
jgi:hypothetical protein